jgi:Mg2+-importing ATPase
MKTNMLLADYAKTPLKKLLTALKTTEHGLTTKEAKARQKQFGKNVIAEERKTNQLLEFLRQFKSPLIIILLLAAAVSIFFGERINATIVLIIVLMSTLLNFLQEKKAGDAAHKLTEKLKTNVTVLRDGKQVDTIIEDIYPGDVLFLNAGDLVPADCRVISAKDSFINQSALTGESFPVEKSALDISGKNPSLSDLTNILLCGTNVVSGTVTAVVLETGKHTEFGKIAHNLNQREDATEFTIGINQFSNLILKATVFIVLAVFFFNIVLKRDVLDSFMFAIAVAVGLTPELLPTILSVTMGRGSLKMAKKGVIVKKLVAIPNFGSMDVLCTDKTGTLTQDKIVLVKYVNTEGKDSDEVLQNAYLNSLYQTGISNPMNEAILHFSKIDTKGFAKVDEIPFDFLRKRMSVVVSKGNKEMLLCKGAPEAVFAESHSVLHNGKKVAMSPAHKAKALATYNNFSKDGYRVLAIAAKTITHPKKVYEVEDESDLTLLGFIVFLDPPKTDVKKVIQDLEAAGVTIKIITGDNELVTKKICSELDIPVHGVMLGHHIDGLTDDALRVAVEKHNIFARFSPDEKNRIIHALRANGHVVGYMGDGINDAPSLKTADVGISVANAVDVAKESADIILTHKSLEVLLNGILEGRKTFGNSMKYIMMGVSSNFGNMFSIIGAVIFLPFLPMLPIQILLNNLLYDVSQITIPGDNVDAEYISKPKRWNLSFVKKFMISFGLISSAFDFLTFFILFKVFSLGASSFQTGWFIESLATQTLIIHVIRTRKTPFLQSRASWALLASTIGIVLLGWAIPYTHLGQVFGFTPLPVSVLGVILGIVAVYLVIVEIGKRIFYKVVPSV